MLDRHETPSRRSLDGSTFEAMHPLHGTLTIHQRAKPETSPSVTFDITLRGDLTVSALHTITVTDRDESVRGEASIGYGDIDLPVGIQGTGTAYLLHHQMARSAVALGVDHFTVENVVNPRLEALCERIGMRPVDLNTFAGVPVEVADRALAKAANRDWSVSQRQLDDRPCQRVRACGR